MSAIAGLWYYDGRPADEPVRRMTHALAHRGPHRSGVWSSSGIGLGNRCLHTTPESMRERQPLQWEDRIVLTADARIDNRDELIRQLDLRSDGSDPVTDAELILAAYLKWGSDSPKRLLGDFAYAIWDGPSRSLFCARDPMGIKPFYYYSSDRLFAFASEIKGLFTLPEVPQRLNQLQVAYYLSGILTDREITFFQDIRRLPAGHWMRLDERGLRREQYWTPADVREVRFASDEAYAEAFLDIFREAVRCRLRSAFPVGSTLSGGMDSSSIVCVAREILRSEERPPLHTFSAVFPDLPAEDLALIDERSHVHAVVAMGGVEAHRIRADRLSPLRDLERVFWHQDEAPLAPNLYLHWGLFEAARGAGVRVLLDGIDGDSAVGHGWGRLDDLLTHHQWDLFTSEANAIARHRGVRGVAVLENYGLPHLSELARRGRWLAWARAALALRRRFPLSRRRLFVEHGLRPALAGLPLGKRSKETRGLDLAAFFIAPEFAEHIELGRHWSAHGKDRRWVGSERQGHIDSLRAPIFQYGLEMIDKAAAAFSLEPRFPYFDRRLMEFCVGLPSEQKFAQGWSRLILRRAMEGILPPQVQWRPGKAKLSPNLHRQFLRADAPLIERALAESDTSAGGAGEYIDLKWARAQYQRALSLRERGEFGAIAERLYQPVTLALWLQHRRRSKLPEPRVPAAPPAPEPLAPALLGTAGEAA